MDTMGALALGTEAPTNAALLRKPYKRNASLISRPMRRNILCQSAFQLTLLFVLLFKGAGMFGVKPIGEDHCLTYYVGSDSQMWDTNARQKSPTGTAGCSNFQDYCPDKDDDCYRSVQRDRVTNNEFTFSSLDGFEATCLDCRVKDYVHGTIIFNAFIFCQVITLSPLHSACPLPSSLPPPSPLLCGFPSFSPTLFFRQSHQSSSVTILSLITPPKYFLFIRFSTNTLPGKYLTSGTCSLVYFQTLPSCL